MNKVYLISPICTSLPQDREADFVAVDGGYLLLKQAGIEPVCCLGDFDTLNDIPEKSLVFPVRKDDSDMALAISWAKQAGYQTIVIWQGLGGRYDHSYANWLSVMAQSVVLADENNEASLLTSGRYSISGWLHHSFFGASHACISIHGLAYELEHYELNWLDPLCLSNHGQGVLTIHSGQVLYIRSNVK